MLSFCTSPRQKEAEELEATQIAVFPDKEIPVDEVGTPYQDMRPINLDIPFILNIKTRRNCRVLLFTLVL